MDSVLEGAWTFPPTRSNVELGEVVTLHGSDTPWSDPVPVMSPDARETVGGVTPKVIVPLPGPRLMSGMVEADRMSGISRAIARNKARLDQQELSSGIFFMNPPNRLRP